MEFSELFLGKKPVFSPNGKFLACLCGDSVDIRYADTLLKAFKFECGDVVKVAKWSCDSFLLLCLTGVNKLKVYSILRGACVASLKQSSGNINQILWASDSRTVLYVEPLLFRATVWKLCEQYGQRSLDYIDNVQPWAKPGVSLSPNGKHFAVVLCDDIFVKTAAGSKDEKMPKMETISIFSAISWRKEFDISCSGIERVGGMVWSPNSDTIVVWPSYPLDPILIVSIRSSSVIGRWQSSSKLWPGVFEVTFSPSAQFMTVVSHNSKVYVLNCLAWCEELELDHNKSILDHKCQIHQEISGVEKENTLFVKIMERPVNISFISSLGKTKKVSNAIWSSGGRYVASCLALAPAVVWIWSAANFFTLSCVISMKHPVQDFQWDPVHNLLAVADGQDCIVLWNADEEKLHYLSICPPVSRMLFQSNHLNWRFDGTALAVSSDQNSTILELTGVKS